MVGVCQSPKRIALRGLIEKFEAELVFDLRKLNIDPATVSFEELELLVKILLRDPTSWLQAAVNGWKFPVSHEWILMANQYDMNAQINSKRKPKPMPRPWPSGNETKVGTTRPDARAILDNAKAGTLEWHNKLTPM